MIDYTHQIWQGCLGKGNNSNSNRDSNTNMANSALISPPPTDVDRTSLACTETQNMLMTRPGRHGMADV